MTKEDLILKAREELSFAEMLYGEEWPSMSPPEMHRNMLIVENFSCLYCGVDFLQSGKLIDIHIDHMDPVSKNGSADLSNTVAVCKSCNLKKGSKPFLSWISSLAEEHKVRALERYSKRKYPNNNYS
ncbi:MAG: HNH endonuclease [Shewanella sp.]